MSGTKARLVKVGNSRGIRLPKSLIEQAGLRDEVELHVRGNAIVVSRSQRARDGWAEAAQRLAATTPGGLLDEAIPTQFDQAEWRW
jgi:antitoxin MazE